MTDFNFKTREELLLLSRDDLMDEKRLTSDAQVKYRNLIDELKNKAIKHPTQTTYMMTPENLEATEMFAKLQKYQDLINLILFGMKQCCKHWTDNCQPIQKRIGKFQEQQKCPKCGAKFIIAFTCIDALGVTEYAVLGADPIS